MTANGRTVVGIGGRVRRVLVVMLGMFAAWIGVSGVHAQPDSVRTSILKEKGFPPDHSPTGALWRSAAVPGWGQYYNRQYYKMPFVYAGYAALAYRIYTTHQEYLFFRRAHLFGRGRELAEDGPNPYQQYEAQFNEASSQLGGERLAAMRSQRDRYRRQRDLAILGTGLFYVLTVLDAYVSAHLLTFDVGDRLSVRVSPTGHLQAVVASSPIRTDRLRIPGETLAERGPGMRLQVQF